MASQQDGADDAVHELLSRANGLLSELSTFAAHYNKVADSYSGDGAHLTASTVNYLRQQLKSEVQALSGILEKQSGPDSVMSTHRVSSTNLPFFESLWAYTKQSHDIVALRKWVCNGQYEGKDVLAPGTHIVHMPGADDSDDDEDADMSDDELEDIPLFKAAKGMAVSAKAYRIRGASPDVRLILPRIASGESKDVDLVLNRIRALGIKVLCSNELENLAPVPLTEEILNQMVPSPLASFSASLNIDTSILIGLISDFSHSSVEKQPWFTAMQLGHLANEQKRQIATTWIYPAMGSRQLICTPEAASTCREIVATIGTPSEVARMNLLLCEDQTMPREQLVQKFQKLSAHEVPADLQLPVKIVDYTPSTSELSSEVWEALRDVTEPTKSVFAFGWASHYTTLTSNGAGITSLTKNLEDSVFGRSTETPSRWRRIICVALARSNDAHEVV
ncbi:hypothetical protein G7054_g3349 [Neopestalotiopsis clavispora]|nr:hypothetical protein G7054_g3349 [Neopestalotiopsis clavispora]